MASGFIDTGLAIFTGALFTMAKNWNWHSTVEWLMKMEFNCTEYYFVVKIWLELEMIILDEVTQN